MSIFDVPDEIFDSHIYSHLSYNDVVRLSQTCKFMKNSCDRTFNEINVIIQKFRYHPNNGLFYACRQGNLKLAKFFVSRGAKNFRIASMFSCAFNHIGLIKYIIDNGLNPYKCLVHASMYGRINIVKYIHKNCFPIKVSIKIKFPLVVSIIHGHLDIVKYYLIEMGMRLLFDAELDIASRYGHLDIVKYLIEERNLSNKLIKRSLPFACKGGHLDVIKYLISKGSHIKSNNSILNLIKYNRIEIIKYFIDNNYYPERVILRYSIDHNNMVITQYLISINTKISVLAFSKASRKGNLEIIKYVLDNAKISRSKLESHLNLIYRNATEYNQKHIIEYLVSHYNYTVSFK